MAVRGPLASVRHGAWVSYNEERLDPIRVVSRVHVLAFDLF